MKYASEKSPKHPHNLRQEFNSHPIHMGMAAAFEDTGDTEYLVRGIEQLEAAYYQEKGAYGYEHDMYKFDGHLDVQHFLSVYLQSQGLH